MRRLWQIIVRPSDSPVPVVHLFEDKNEADAWVSSRRDIVTALGGRLSLDPVYTNGEDRLFVVTLFGARINPPSVRVYSTLERAREFLVSYIFDDERWEEKKHLSSTQALSNMEIIQQYFEAHPDEHYCIDELELDQED